jgi:hypothetical protein
VIDFCKLGNEPSGSIKGEDFLDCMVLLPSHFQDAMAERRSGRRRMVIRNQKMSMALIS